MYGLTSSGFIAKRLADSKAELEQAFRDKFGAGIKLTEDTIFGKLIGIFAEREASEWEAREADYNSSYPNSASDVSLDGVCEITATKRNGALTSLVTAYISGINNTIIPKSSLFSVQDSEAQFKTLSEITLAGSQLTVIGITRSGTTVTVNITSHNQTAGKRVFLNDAVETDYNGLHTIDTVVDADNFTYETTLTPTTPATGSITCDPTTAVNLESVETGAIEALAGTLNQIVKSISGFTRIENDLDATKGRNKETDAELRIRRIAALQGLGSARLEAIRGALLQVEDVTAVTVFENETKVVDSGGRPASSIECLVLGGVDQDILDAVFNKKAAGIESYGLVSGTVTDSQGINHTSKFSRPTSVNIYLELDLTTNTDFPGTSDVLSRLLTYGDSLLIGDDVIVFPYLISSFNDVPGITDLVVRIGTAASPTLDDNIVISETEIADFDSARITINLV